MRDCHCGSEQLLAGPGPGFSCCRQPTVSSPGRNLSRGEENVSENGDVRLKDGAGGEGFQGCPHRHIQGLGHAGSASGGTYGRTPGSGGVAQGRVYAPHTHSPGFHLQYHAHPQTVRRKNEILYPSGPCCSHIRPDVCLLPRLCTLRCSPQSRKFPISSSRWPLPPGLKPPSWDTRYLGDRVRSPRGQVKRVPDPHPNFCFRCPRWPSTLSHSPWLRWALLRRR